MKGILNDRKLSKSSEILIMGDININLLNYDSHTDTGDYLNTLLLNSQLPLITLPSRITNTSATLIDHISTNGNHDNLDCGLVYSSLSDHLPVFYINSINTTKVKSNTKVQVRNTSNNNKTKFKNKLLNVDWSPMIIILNRLFIIFLILSNPMLMKAFHILKSNQERINNL